MGEVIDEITKSYSEGAMDTDFFLKIKGIQELIDQIIASEELTHTCSAAEKCRQNEMYFSLQKLILKFIKANADLREGNVLKKKKSGGDSKKNSTKKIRLRYNFSIAFAFEFQFVISVSRSRQSFCVLELAQQTQNVACAAHGALFSEVFAET